MAKRTIQVCDLSKKEFSPDEGYTITIKKPGKDKGQTYELCAEIAQALLEILNHDKKVGYVSGEPVAKLRREPRSQETEDFQERDIDGDDEEWFAAKQAEVKSMQRGHVPEGGSSQFENDNKECIHVNKTPARFDSKIEGFFQMCKDCGERVRMRKEE